MARSAHVTSIDAVGQFKAALQNFESDVRDGLTTLQLESRRGMEWVTGRTVYWTRQVRIAGERLNEARNALERAQLSLRPEDQASCYQEKKDVAKAKQRLRFAEEKVLHARQWCQQLHHEIDKFQGKIGRLSQITDVDLARGVAALERVIRALDRYTQRGTADPAPAPSQSLKVADQAAPRNTTPPHEDINEDLRSPE